MIKTELILPYRYNDSMIRQAISDRLPIGIDEIRDVRIVRRELMIEDGRIPRYKTSVAFSADSLRERSLLNLKNKVRAYDAKVFSASPSFLDFRPVVVGAGPSGLFAALALAESGARPIVIERGLSIDERGDRVKLFNTLGILDTECNVQFGEGGAGTYSDGKLKVGVHDQYKLRVLSEFVEAGADESILFSSSAHLGTDKLPDLVKAVRQKAESLGAEFIFSAKLTAVNVKDGKVKSITYVKDGEETELPTRAVILAIGHSARDTIKMLKDTGLPMSAKGFGIGLRIEHPREHINRIVYKDAAPYVEETASYHLVTHLDNGRSVYSFCMCPGGTVVAATSENECIVTNGMSRYDRMGDNSNAALLVSVTPDDFASDDPLAGIELQRKIERGAYAISSEYRAPSYNLSDFMQKRACSVHHGTAPTYPLKTVVASPDEYLPDFVCESLRTAMSDFDAWLSGYAYADATLTGPETRTTSPVRIERNEGGEAHGFMGIYPTGEGAGYAGGIVSSAIDGIKNAEKLIGKYSQNN